MNKLILLVGLALTACTTQPTKQVVVPTKKTVGRESPDAANKQVIENKSVSSQLIEIKPDMSGASNTPKPAPQTNVNVELYAKLDRAAKTQNQNLIKQYSLEILQNNSKDTKGLNALAMYYYTKSIYRTAEQLLNSALANNQEMATVYNNLGLVFQAQGNPRRAIDYFKKSVESSQEHPGASENLGSIYVRAQQFAKAVDVLQPVMAIKTITESSKINYAIALTGTNQFTEAVAVYEKILTLNSNQNIALVNLAAIKIDKLSLFSEGLDLLNRLKFVDTDLASQNIIKTLENKAKAGLK